MEIDLYPPWRTAFRPAEHLEDESSEAMRDMRTSEASAGRSSRSEHLERASTRTVWMARNSRGETTGVGDDEGTSLDLDAITWSWIHFQFKIAVEARSVLLAFEFRVFPLAQQT